MHIRMKPSEMPLLQEVIVVLFEETAVIPASLWGPGEVKMGMGV